MSHKVKIYVYLPEEAVDTWRPVLAEHLHDNIYRIIEQEYDRSDETWQFNPGDVVVCEIKKFYEGQGLTAISKVNSE